jgi:5-methylthioadenosine/S-adenosylhomocysteine deaminase
MWPVHNPIAAALHAHAGNIKAVIIAGVWRKHRHAFIGVDGGPLMETVRVAGVRFVRHVRSPGPLGRVRAHIVRHAVRRQLQRQVNLGNPSSR